MAAMADPWDQLSVMSSSCQKSSESLMAMASTCSHCLTTTAPNAAKRLKIRLRNQQRLIQGLGEGDGGGGLNEATSLTRGLFAQAR